MPAYRYLHLDVFTDRRLEGNQLAVVFDAADVPDPVMQTVAREMAFSETVFVVPPATRDAVARLRIFTPGRELPMAGHPTIGSAFALAHDGRLAAGRPDAVVDLGVGPTKLELEWEATRLSFAWMSQPLPEFGPVVDAAPVAEALGLAREEIVSTQLPAQVVSCGVPYLLVPVATRAAVDRAWTGLSAIERLTRTAGVTALNLFVFSLERGTPDADVYSRMFGPVFGIAEDPATGSAAGPLGSYLVRHGSVPAGVAPSRIVNLQGVKMQRPSRIVIAIDGTAHAITRVRIGGTSVLVAEGTLFL